MKFISKFLNTIAGLFRIFITIAFLWGIIFTFFVDRNLLTSFYDLLGFDSISPEIIKIVTLVILAFCFFINLIVSKHIFKANKTGQYLMSNMFFGFIFILLDLGIYFFTREEKLFYFLIFSVILILGSMFGLGAKAKGLYPTLDKEEKNTDDNKVEEDVEEEKEKEENIIKSIDNESLETKEVTEIQETIANPDITDKQKDTENNSPDKEETIIEEKISPIDKENLEDVSEELLKEDDNKNSKNHTDIDQENQNSVDTEIVEKEENLEYEEESKEE